MEQLNGIRPAIALRLWPEANGRAVEAIEAADSLRASRRPTPSTTTPPDFCGFQARVGWGGRPQKVRGQGVVLAVFRWREHALR